MKKLLLIPAAIALVGTGLSAQPAAARGCIKGALVGGVAGHYAGHHGLLGAAGGCVVGRHMANKQARDAEYRDRAVRDGYDGPADAYR